MKLFLRILFFFSLLSGIYKVYAQDTAGDTEQQYLSSCYYYSGVMGYNIDSICNPELFQSISNWLGVRYRYSGDSKNGIDCSDFASVIYKDAYNETLEGSAADIYKSVSPVKKSKLKEGDLVFFKIRKKKISHVGVYLSHNKFAHASVHEGVVVSDLDEPYYKKYFYKGGRVKG